MREGVLSFHMPGHQQGRGAPRRFQELVGRRALQADISQVLGMDDLHRPVSACGEAQRLAAEAYGAEATYFLVNGSSSGNQAMMLAALRPGEELVLPRNVHRSVLAGLMLADARPVFVTPEMDPEMGVAHGVSPGAVRRALDLHPQAAALLYTSPDYYGAVADGEALVGLGHERGLPVLVDEAWGAHLPFHPSLPRHALSWGADLVVNSTHKLLAGMSQAALLHRLGDRVDRGRVEAAVRLLQSTSPSCLLVASLDVARHQVATRGEAILGRVIDLAERARRGLGAIPGVRCFEPDRPGAFGWDPTRLVVQTRGLTGREVERRLRLDHGIQVEMSDLLNVVALLTPGHEEDDVDRLVSAFRGLPREGGSLPAPPPLPDLPERSLTLREAFNSPWQTVPLDLAVGRVCTEMVTPYPPGIPLICPGEVISLPLLEYLRVVLEAGVPIQGCADPTLATVRVARDSDRRGDP